MTDKPKDNVKPLFKGIAIDTEELKPIAPLVEYVRNLLSRAESGQLRTLVSVEEYEDSRTSVNMLGEIIDVNDIYTHIEIAKDMCYNKFVIPNYAIQFVNRGEEE